MSGIKYETKTEFFECDCHDRDDLIIANRNFYTYNSPHMTRDMDITLEMVTWVAEWNEIRGDNTVTEFLFKKWWRIKKAIEILFTGKIRSNGYWMPARIDSESGALIGTEETRRLGNFLIESANMADEFYNELNRNTKITL